MARTLYVQDRRLTGQYDFLDPDGYPSFWFDPDTALVFVIDWSRFLGSDTISTSTWESDAVARSSASSTSTTTQVKLSGSPNVRDEVTNTIVTAGGQTVQQTFRLYEREA